MTRLSRKKVILWRGESFFGGEASPSFSQLDIPPLFAPHKIATGRSHLLVLDCDDNVWVLGDGKSGQLGLGDETFCALLKKNTNIHSSLKDRQRKTRAPSISMTRSTLVPETTGGWSRAKNASVKDDTIVSVHAGPLTSAAITSSGRLLIWGYSHGKTRFVPEVISMWESYKVKDVGFGDQHVLVLVETMKQGNKSTLLLSWGKSSCGALGYGEGEKKASEGKQLRFFDDKNPLRICTGHRSSMVILENGEIYMWGKVGNFSAWTPQKIALPGLGPLFGLHLGDENCLIQRANILYCINLGAPNKGPNGLSVQFSKMAGFDCEIHGIITNIDCDSRHTILSNHRGQLIISPEEVVTTFSALHVIGRLGFVEYLGSCARAFVILCDTPLLQQSVERNVQLQPGNYRYRVPRIIHDIVNYFIEIPDSQVKESRGQILLEFNDSEVDSLYEEYIELSGADLSRNSVAQIFQLMICYLVNLKEPLVPTNLYPSLVHKFRHAEPAYRRTVFLKEVIVNDLPAATASVVKEVLQLIHRCFYMDVLVVPTATTKKLEEILFSSFFGDPDKKQIQDLKKIFKLIIKFPGFWFGDETCTIPIQLDVIAQEKNQLELLSMFISEFDGDRDSLCKIISATPVIKTIISAAITEPLQKDQEWLDMKNILMFCIGETKYEKYLQFLKEANKEISAFQCEAIGSLYHLLCSASVRPPVISTIMPLLIQIHQSSHEQDKNKL